MHIRNRARPAVGCSCGWLFAGWFLVLACLSSQALAADDARPPAPNSGGVQAQTAPVQAADGSVDWRIHLRKVHARFTGRKGTFAQFGDSITDTMAFWTPLQYTRKNASPEMEKAFAAVKSYLQPECWRDWKGPDYGSQGGQTTEWALKNIDGWLKRLNPEVALVLFGTNDLHSLETDAYTRNLRSLVRKCLDNGTVVILSTIPPRHGFEKKAAEFAEAARKVAQENGVPLTDFYAEILQRRPDDWDGALDKFNAYKDYDVPTLLARDGVHPSYPQKYQNDYSEEALRNCGYGLRNALTLLKYTEVIGALKAEDRREAREGDRDMEKDTAGDKANQNPDLPHPTPAPRLAAWPPPDQPWFPKGPRLPAPTGEILRVATVEELYAAVERVPPGGTILVADGHYKLPRPLEIKTDRVALRGASGRRERVVLDGGNQGELVRLTACSGVTIAELTVQNVRWNGIKINSETGVQKLTIYNCVLHNIWQRAVKGVKVPEKDRDRLRPTGFRVQYCLFWNDRPKQYSDDPADTDQNFQGNYIGGIDAMYPRDWVISDNVFIGIHGRTGEARGAVFLWHDAQHCVVERNMIIDCDEGICLGNSFRPEDVTIHCTGCIVRNNFITRAHENGILADYTKDCKILNNTIYDPESRLGRLIRIVHDNEGLLVANNLVCGPTIRIESQSKVTLRNNLEKDLSAALADPAHGNLRLIGPAAEVIARGVPLPDVTEDIDRVPRGHTPAIGASEFRLPERPVGP